MILLIGTDAILMTLVLGEVYLMTCLKIWKRCLHLVVLVTHKGTTLKQTADSMDQASTVELSLSDEETWLPPIQIVQGSDGPTCEKLRAYELN